MSSAITPSLRASLERLKHAGSINGLCLAWRRQILVNLMPFEEFRVEQLVQTVNDTRDHFQSGGGRLLDTLWIGFADVHALTVFGNDISLTLLHTRGDESDFLTGVAKTFLSDAQLAIDMILSPESASGDDASGAGGDAGTSADAEWNAHHPRPDPNQTHLVS